MSKQTLILIIVLFFFTGGLLLLAFNRSSSYTPKATPVKAILPTPTINPYLPNTSLLFGNLQTVLATSSAIPKSNASLIESTPSAISTSSAKQTQQGRSNTYSIPIIIQTGENNVTVVQLELSYNPSILTDVSINPSGFFENPAVLLDKIDTKNGRLSYALGDRVEGQDLRAGKKGEGTLAILTFRTIAKSNLKISELTEEKTASDAAKTSITFLPKTFVVAEGIAESALKSTNSAELRFPN